MLESKFEVLPHQGEAWKALTSGKGHILLRGSAAGGKSWLIGEYVKQFPKDNVMIVEDVTAYFKSWKGESPWIAKLNAANKAKRLEIAAAASKQGKRILATTNEDDWPLIFHHVILVDPPKEKVKQFT